MNFEERITNGGNRNKLTCVFTCVRVCVCDNRAPERGCLRTGTGADHRRHYQGTHTHTAPLATTPSQLLRET